MLTIRHAQFASLKHSTLRSFDEEMVTHVKSFAPWHKNSRAGAYLNDAVRCGRERAARHGFWMRGPVQFYIELMCILGAGFDTDPQYPWARAILDNTADGEFVRADRLHARAMNYLRRAAGAASRHARVALDRMRSVGVDLVTAREIRFETAALEGIRRLYPEKCEYVGQTALENLIEAGMTFAEINGAVEPADRGFCIGAMFALGHNFASDPLLPWSRTALAWNGAPASERFIALRAGFKSYLDQILDSTLEAEHVPTHA
ncbi:MAG TPA: hypothetical protein VHW24_05885 [Bryobacteraceae bacterium]|nr:hypothetical protein [Bryobacteraceae bacterium]